MVKFGAVTTVGGSDKPDDETNKGRDNGNEDMMAAIMFQSYYQNARRTKRVRHDFLRDNLLAWRQVFTPHPIPVTTPDSAKKEGAATTTEAPEEKETSITVQDIALPDIYPIHWVIGNHAFSQWKHVLQLDNLLTPDECRRLVQAAEGVGFKSSREISLLDFPEYYDSSEGGGKSPKNTSMLTLVEDVDLARTFWLRIRGIIQQHCPELELYLRRPSRHQHDDDDNAEDDVKTITLTPVGVCPLMRVLKYSAGQEFLAHTDGVDWDEVNICSDLNPAETTAGGVNLRSKRGHFRSCLTLAIYLNDGGHGDGTGDFDGGALHFVQKPKLVKREFTPEEAERAARKGNISSLVQQHSPYPEPITIQPQQGRAAIFHQLEHHEAHALTRGYKYMIQTSVLFALPVQGL